jgi:hypothetical protein
MRNFATKPKTPIEAFTRLVQVEKLNIEVPENFNYEGFDEDTTMSYIIPIDHEMGSRIMIDIIRDGKLSYHASYQFLDI